MTPPRIAPVPYDALDDPELRALVDHAAETKAPPAVFQQVMANHPEVAKARAALWEQLFRAGLVEHQIKERMRVHIAELQNCVFCASQRSSDAGPEDAHDEDACELPEHGVAPGDDARTRAALRYARELTLADDGSVFDDVYVELRCVFTDAEIIELGCLAAFVIGGTRFVRSLGLQPGQSLQPGPQDTGSASGTATVTAVSAGGRHSVELHA